MRPAWLTKSTAEFVFIIQTWNGKKNGYWLFIKWVVQVYLVL
jgi:hypothetical protein